MPVSQLKQVRGFLSLQIRVSQKYTFFEFRFVLRITGANGCPEATKKISALQTHKRHLAIDFQYSRGYTRENFQKSIFGHKILQEHATTIQLALLSYIFIALSRDTSLAPIYFAYGPMAIWPNMAIWPYGHIFGHMAIGPYATNMGKWGIPGKSYKNVAQQC